MHMLSMHPDKPVHVNATLRPNGGHVDGLYCAKATETEIGQASPAQWHRFAMHLVCHTRWTKSKRIENKVFFCGMVRVTNQRP